MAFKDLYINPLTGDLDLTNSRIRLTETVQESVRQKVEVTLKTYTGEYFANILFGVPYLENDNNNIQLLGKTSKTIFDTTIKEKVLGVEGVINITSYRSILDQISGELDISFRAEIESGELIPIAINETL
tara:strand:- start:1256 stop:1645 length:390 start_codon:yes stop_codon:yes gene_type:complete